MMLPGYAGVVITFVAWTLPESPRWLMSKKGYEAGFAALKRVRHGDVTEEAREIYASIQAQSNIQKVPYSGLVFGDANLRTRFLVCVGMQIAQQMTGVNAFLTYANQLFAQLGFTNETQKLEVNVLFQGVQMISCVAGILLVDSKWGGRRTLLLWATVMMFVPMIVGGFAIMQSVRSLSLLSVIIYALGFQLAWGIVPWVYPGELFSLTEKDRAVSVAIGLEYLFNAIIVIITPFLLTWSIANTLFAFAAFNILNFIFVYACVKETKGVSIEKIPALFQRQRAVHSS